MARPIKISVNLQVEVDPDEWVAAFGNGSTPAEVREAVKRYVLNNAQYAPCLEESGAKVTLKQKAA